MSDLDEARAAAYLLDGEEAAARLCRPREVVTCPRCQGVGIDPKAFTWDPTYREADHVVRGRWVKAACDLCEGHKQVQRDPRPRQRWGLRPWRRA